MLEMNRPKGWRKGQTIFNFLEFLRRKGAAFDPKDLDQAPRMADPFHLSDERFDKLYKEFLSEFQGQDSS